MATTRSPAALDNLLGLTHGIYRNESAQAFSIGAFALATRAPAVLDLLARGAGFETFSLAVEAARTGTISGGSLPWLRELGRVSYQMVDDDGAAVSIAFFEAARKLNSAMGFRELDALAFLEALLVERGPEALESELARHSNIAPLDRACLVADSVRARFGAPTPEWVSALNTGIFLPAGLSEIALRDGEGPLFDRLSGTAPRSIADGPLVTVVMTTFRRRSEIVVAVRSILEQTWRNLELIIVDDASGPEFDPLLDEIAEWDERVRVLRMPRNGGAYVGRNAALGIARGEYVTFQDDDDWSHPERIERQVAPLIADADVAITLSMCVRSTEEMSFRYRAAKTSRRNASSLMFRLADGRRAGLYDTVRKAADSEYIERLLTITGGRREVVDAVLSLVRLSTASLSRADFGVGWHHPARDEYREAYQNYHHELLHGRARPLDGNTPRQFPAPRRFLGAEDTAELPREFDVVVASDWRYVGTGFDTAFEILEVARSAGKSAGIIHLPDPRNPGKGLQALAPRIRRVLAGGAATRVLAEDVVDIGHLVVDDVARLQLMSADPWACTVGSVSAIALDAPVEADPASSWSIGDVVPLLHHVFEPRSVRWLGADRASTETLHAHGIDATRIDYRRIALMGDRPATTRSRGPEVRVGRVVAPVTGALPAPDLCEFAYPSDGSSDVRVLALAGARSRIAAHWPVRWLIYGSADIAFEDFVRQIDVYAIFGNDIESPGSVSAALRAAASGCLVIADERLQPELGEAAIYCDVADAQATVSQLFRDPHAYQAHTARAMAWCGELRSEPGSAQVLRTLIESV